MNQGWIHPSGCNSLKPFGLEMFQTMNQLSNNKKQSNFEMIRCSRYMGNKWGGNETTMFIIHMIKKDHETTQKYTIIKKYWPTAMHKCDHTQGGFWYSYGLCVFVGRVKWDAILVSCTQPSFKNKLDLIKEIDFLILLFPLLMIDLNYQIEPWWVHHNITSHQSIGWSVLLGNAPRYCFFNSCNCYDFIFHPTICLILNLAFPITMFTDVTTSESRVTFPFTGKLISTNYPKHPSIQQLLFLTFYGSLICSHSGMQPLN